MADGTTSPAGTDPNLVTMTQEKLDQIIEERLKRQKESLTAEHKKNLTDLQQLQTSLKMTEQEKADYAARLEELEKQYLSKDELAAKEAKKNKEKYDTDLKSATERAAAAEQRYTTSRIDSELAQAVARGGVLDNTVPFVMSYLRPNTKLVPEVNDDGQPTGRDKVVVLVHDPKEGQIEVTPSQALDRLAESNGNLFDTKSRGGFGGDSGSKSKTGYRPGMSTKEYMELRKKNPDAIYDSPAMS